VSGLTVPRPLSPRLTFGRGRLGERLNLGFCVPMAFSMPPTATIAVIGAQNASGTQNVGERPRDVDSPLSALCLLGRLAYRLGS
jgi:hypothetical protein